MEKRKRRIEESSSSTIMPSLPEEIIENILLRLPTKSLVRFTSVSKQWLSLISNPNFTKTHLNRLLLDQSNNHQRLFVMSFKPCTFYSIDYDSPNPIPVQRNFPLSSPRGLEILGSCNGLFLVDLNGKSLYLWNPLFRDLRRLRRPNRFSSYFQNFGFGYDSSTDDYKVVSVVTVSQLQKVEVYTLKTNSWRRITDVPYRNLENIYGPGGTLVNGCLYWRMMEVEDENGQEDEDGGVLGFDLADEKFRLVRLPHLQVRARWSYHLSVVRGCLATDQIYFESPLVVVWILKEDRAKNEFLWTKFMKIPNADEACSLPLCYTKSGEILLSIDNEENGTGGDQLVLYNEKNLSCREYLICGTSFWSREHMNIESLVSPKGV